MKIKQIRLLAFLMSLMFLIAIGCNKDEGDDPIEEEPTEEEDPTNGDDCVTEGMIYNGEIKTIIDNSCATSNCHAGTNSLPSLATYNDVVSRIDRVSARALDLQTMPPAGPLEDCDMKKLKAWIEAGTPEE